MFNLYKCYGRVVEEEAGSPVDGHRYSFNQRGLSPSSVTSQQSFNATVSGSGSKTMICFSKHAKCYSIVKGIQAYQSVPYSIQPHVGVMDYLRGEVEGVDLNVDFWAVSCLVEVRERDGDVARVLEESGFL